MDRAVTRPAAPARRRTKPARGTGVQIALAAVRSRYDVDPHDRIATLDAQGVGRAAGIADDRHEPDAQPGGDLHGLARRQHDLTVDRRRGRWTLSKTGRRRQETKCQEKLTHERMARASMSPAPRNWRSSASSSAMSTTTCRCSLPTTRARSRPAPRSTSIPTSSFDRTVDRRVTPPATGCGPGPAARGRSTYRGRPVAPRPVRGSPSP